MRLKHFPLLIPTLLVPYAVIATLAILFGNSRLIDVCFGGNAFGLIFLLLIYIAFASATLVAYIILSIATKTEPMILAGEVMLLKLLQIPAYIAIFVFGCMFFITIFTAPFSLALVVFDYATLLLTGVAFTFALLIGSKTAKLDHIHIALAVISQFFFCIDVAVAVWFFVKLKNKINCVSDAPQ